MITLVWARTWLRAAIVNSIVFASVCISKQIDDDLRLFDHYCNGHVTDPFFFFILPYLLWHRREVLNILLGVPTSKESLSRNFLKISKRISVLISTRANATQTLAMLLDTAVMNYSAWLRLQKTNSSQGFRDQSLSMRLHRFLWGRQHCVRYCFAILSRWNKTLDWFDQEHYTDVLVHLRKRNSSKTYGSVHHLDRKTYRSQQDCRPTQEHQPACKPISSSYAKPWSTLDHHRRWNHWVQYARGADNSDHNFMYRWSATTLIPESIKNSAKKNK